MKNLFLLFAAALFFAGCSQNKPGDALDAEAFSDQLEQTPEAIILDVRTPQEFDEGHLTNARNIDWNAPDFLSRVENLDKKAAVFVYCLSGGRSGEAAAAMRANGYKHVHELAGGILAWRSAGLPQTAGTGTAPEPAAMSLTDFNNLKASGNVLVDFYAPWCAPCRKMEPSLNELAQTCKGRVRIVRINIDQQQQLAKQLNVSGIPLLRLYRSGTLTWSHSGFADKALLSEKLHECN